MMKILVINGPNMQLLGKREPEVYGRDTLSDIEKTLTDLASDKGVKIIFFQSNHEGEILDELGASLERGVDGIIINPAAYTHTSIAIRDAIKAVGIPAVEVHMSNINSRENFRHNSVTAPVCIGQICGFGMKSYEMALNALFDYISN